VVFEDPDRMEIVALADTTAELSSPWRAREIRVVRAIVALFKRAWRELRQAPSPSTE